MSKLRVLGKKNWTTIHRWSQDHQVSEPQVHLGPRLAICWTLQRPIYNFPQNPPFQSHSEKSSFLPYLNMVFVKYKMIFRNQIYLQSRAISHKTDYSHKNLEKELQKYFLKSSVFALRIKSVRKLLEGMAVLTWMRTLWFVCFNNQSTSLWQSRETPLMPSLLSGRANLADLRALLMVFS